MGSAWLQRRLGHESRPCSGLPLRGSFCDAHRPWLAGAPPARLFPAAGLEGSELAKLDGCGAARCSMACSPGGSFEPASSSPQGKFL